MKIVSVLLSVLFAVFYPTLSMWGQTETLPPNVFLDKWADAETVQNWGKAIHAGRVALTEGRTAEAAASFRKAIEVCEPKASQDIHPCIARLLLAEALLADGFNDEVVAQTDQLVARLKKATRYTESKKLKGTAKYNEEEAVNSYKYQVGAALYLRAARIYLRLNLPRRAEPLFDPAVRIFDQFIYEDDDYETGQHLRSFYSLLEFRVAEIHEAKGRFHLITGDDKKAFENLRTAAASKKMEPIYYSGLPEGMKFTISELFVDQLVAEPLQKSSLQRLLDDCAFYRFDDARIADLLVRQAALLRKVGRADEATAFERFAESLRKPRLKP